MVGIWLFSPLSSSSQVKARMLARLASTSWITPMAPASCSRNATTNSTSTKGSCGCSNPEEVGVAREHNAEQQQDDAEPAAVTTGIPAVHRARQFQDC